MSKKKKKLTEKEREYTFSQQRSLSRKSALRVAKLVHHLCGLDWDHQELLFQIPYGILDQKATHLHFHSTSGMISAPVGSVLQGSLSSPDKMRSSPQNLKHRGSSNLLAPMMLFVIRVLSEKSFVRICLALLSHPMPIGVIVKYVKGICHASVIAASGSRFCKQVTDTSAWVAFNYGPFVKFSKNEFVSRKDLIG